jgi:7-cyano-7-deazaguanine synthase
MAASPSVPDSKHAVVLLSGGLDSTVALADVLTRQSVACVLTFDYGQRAAAQELKATRAIARHYGLTHHIIPLPWLSDLLPKALTPKRVLEDQGVSQAPPATEAELFDVNRVWVPNRNGLFLNIAACYAEALKADTIVFGANAEEGVDFPDNTEAFRQKMTEVFAFSTLNGVQVEAPLVHLSKTQIIDRGLALKVPFEWLWSCYEDAETQCGQCPSCIRVQNAQRQLEAQTGQAAGIAFQ